jgi:hypothetical protein
MATESDRGRLGGLALYSGGAFAMNGDGPTAKTATKVVPQHTLSHSRKGGRRASDRPFSIVTIGALGRHVPEQHQGDSYAIHSILLDGRSFRHLLDPARL